MEGGKKTVPLISHNGTERGTKEAASHSFRQQTKTFLNLLTQRPSSLVVLFGQISVFIST
jgi:hypothetical protein